jgi:SAM-dependent methyltransferase
MSFSTPWAPLGQALLDYEAGHHQATLQVHLESGTPLPLPAEHFFAPPADDLDLAALDLCRGHVLDAGAGAGRHALALQEEGLEVTALEICPEAVDIMVRRGVARPLRGELFEHHPEKPYDTVFLLMNGLGLAGTLEGLEALLAPGGQILADSCDIHRIDDPDEQYRAAARISRGLYPGETLQRLTYGTLEGAPFPWLYIDPDLLTTIARAQGWVLQRVFESAEGPYLVRLVPAL